MESAAPNQMFSIEDSEGGENILFQSPIHCVFTFRRPVQFSDRVIRALTGPWAHVDLLVITDQTPEDSPSFTTYMGETFSMSIRTKNRYNNREYTGLYLKMMPDEAFKVFEYVMKLAERRVPYNLGDLTYQPVKKLLQGAGARAEAEPAARSPVAAEDLAGPAEQPAGLPD
eukprot:1942-Hanusia_phi.AAC.2